VPEIHAAEELAAQLRSTWLGLDENDPVDPVDACERLGVALAERPRKAPGGQLQGSLMPLSSNSFEIEVDANPHDGWVTLEGQLRDEVLRHRFRFLVMHELAHTLFYEPGEQRPKRLLHASAEQEAFCDRLAGAMLVPPDVARRKPIHPSSILELHRQFDVSIEVAARSLVSAYGDAPLCWLLLRNPEGSPSIQWRPPRAMAARRPWATLEELLGQLGSSKDQTASSQMHWRRGGPTTAHALLLSERRQIVVTAAPPSTD